MPLTGVAGMLWTRLMLADPSYGQDVRKPTRQDHAVWEVQPELDTRGFGDGSLRHWRMKRPGTWELGTGCSERKN